MSVEDRAVIMAFAKGDQNLRKAAIEIHRRSIPLLGVRGTPEQDFMAEVDNPSPDLALRSTYRAALLKTESPAQALPEPTPPAPKPGVEFLHRRLLNPKDLSQPARCVVTSIRQGCVYYAYADRSGGHEYCTIARWPKIAAPLPQTIPVQRPGQEETSDTTGQNR
jgi:hypothetical protein